MLNKEQRIATYPRHSVWLSASAGTGKTKVLTDRTLRLLLEGVQPEKILCITFTKAAASEMLVRILRELYNWGNCSEEKLYDNLYNLLGREPSQLHIEKAKRLYLDINYHNSQINIQTIHSFCQSIISRFPVEMGVVPGVRVIDELERKEIIDHVIYQMSVTSPSDATLYLLAHLHQTTFDEMISNILANAMRFHYFLDSNSGWYDSALRKLLHLPLRGTKEDVYASALQATSRLLKAFEEHEALPHSLAHFTATEEFYLSRLKPFFLTKSGSPRAKLLPKAVATEHDDLYQMLLSVQSIIVSSEDDIKSYQIHEYTGYMLQFIQEFLSLYTDYKASHSLLDYDDLIYKTASFLHRGENKHWVLYKLDGGIEYVLVDEAQDTSHYQWQIIESLIAEFYAGQGAEGRGSLFVVGDPKQSIYSFQGADIDIFYNMKKTIGDKIRLGGGDFQYIDLLTSYRSSHAVLNLVDSVFIPMKDLRYHSLQCFRVEAEGKVELWNLSSDKFALDLERTFWKKQEISKVSELRSLALAQHIARYIQEQVQGKVILPKTGKPASYGDFMILIRKRGKFSNMLSHSLSEAGVSVAGLDRIELQNSKIIAAIIYLSKFIMQPEDNHNLILLLMGPLFNYTQEEIHNLAYHGDKRSIWSLLQEQQHPVGSDLQLCIDLYNDVNLEEFYNITLKIHDFEERLLSGVQEEGVEVLESFLNILSSYIDSHGCNMHGFIIWLEGSDLEIKRDLGKVDKVKILTVHGAKGLESPVVFIPETNDVPRSMRGFILQEKLFIAAKNRNFHNRFYSSLLDEIKEKQYQEYIRLLYVALTRAQDHLIICGDDKARMQEYASWYKLVSPHIADVKELDADVGAENQVLGAITRPIYEPLKAINDHSSSDKNYKQDMSNAVSYGQIVHKLLGDLILLKGELDLDSHPLLQLLDSAQRRKALAQSRDFMGSKLWEYILEHDASIEVPLGVKAGDEFAQGRIDLLLRSESVIMIIDFKSDHNPPSSRDQVPDSYTEQLLFYHQTMTNIVASQKQDVQILSYIMWLENMNLMQLFDSRG